MSEKTIPTSAKECRQRYDIGRTAWWGIIKNLGIRKHAKIYTPLEKQIIIAKLGLPE